MQKKAIILLSGGLDSITVLAQAQKQGYLCYTLSFDYGQRHNAELNSAREIARDYQVEEHIDVPNSPQEGIPVTYVPARNTVFLSFALGWAEVLGAYDIFIGVNAVDYSGYPDCRPEFINAFQVLANLATKAGVEGSEIKIHAPLIQMSKADIIKQGISLGVEYNKTVSCYSADKEGKACGVCDACRLRKIGFEDAKVSDPTRYQ